MAAIDDGQVQPPGRLGAGLFVIAASLIPLCFALYTNHIWEDYFITFRHSENLCHGHGLVFQPGEAVHGFTSPLGSLLPALGCWITGGSYLPSLWFLRVVSIAAFVGGGLLLSRTLVMTGAPRAAVIALGVLYVLDVKAVDFTINGMETAFMLLFVAWAVYLFQKDVSRHWLALGLCWAGLLWTRPDGCVYIAVLSLGTVVYSEGSRKCCLIALLKAAAVCAVIYLPWLLWAWSYYGSPVPHTIIAKANYAPEETLGHFLSRLVRFYPQMMADVFRPSYFNMGGWPAVFETTTQLLGLLCATYWLLPIKDGVGKLASLSFAILTFYMSAMAYPFPWYMPPVAMLGLLVLTRGVFAYMDLVGKSRAMATVVPCIALTLLAVESLWLFGAVAWQMRIQQAEVETGNRVVLGLWLRDHVGPDERIYLEPAGYIGYFSGRKLLDHPGLVSPEVVEAIREGHGDFCQAGLYLQPEWMVLRPEEFAQMSASPAFTREYRLVKVFDVTGKLSDYCCLPGQAYVERDAAFQVFRRIEVSTR
jgi:hypothetical protein